ncbi:acyl homoserine lactone synthase [Rhizobium sp. NFR07]|uniref:acyl-homoserine-lactone synthase n=1 Tax=Rhizobium sp. NFR07 TaxID=1566262 RepID=UPI0008E2AD99|nr:acyl-homoserine-lactone synthase [Rhizobium sp. NFR07]SFB59972.1 acyl homoserine lactone synthase [Rhizobium sp. NFR07]
MKALAVSRQGGEEERRLIHAQHGLRARVFSGRLGWSVTVADGIEADAFDCFSPTYILAVLDTGVLAGCARLLPATGPTMLETVFSQLLPPTGLPAHQGMVESSRFCVDTSITASEPGQTFSEATLTLLAAILEWCLYHHYTQIVTVTDLRFERILSRVGWRFDRLAAPCRIGVTDAIAGILPVDCATFLRLRPQGYRSEILSSCGAA